MCPQGLEPPIPRLGVRSEPVVDALQWSRVEIVEALAPGASDPDEADTPKRVEVLRHGLARHRQAHRELTERLSRPIPQAIQQNPSRRVGDGLEDGFHSAHYATLRLHMSMPLAGDYDPPVRLVDSHCHVNAERFEHDADAVLARARAAGVERILVPGWNVASSRRALDLVERTDWLDAAVGVHPHDAARVDDGDWLEIQRWASDDRVRAIGETGLDYDRVFSPIPAQGENLRRNLRLALETGKPAILHVRSKPGLEDAQDAMLAELRRAGMGGAPWTAAFGDRPPAVLHSFSGSVVFARAALDLGVAISISGLAFRKGEEATANVVGLVPPMRLLVETDSPFLAPPGAPRGRNEPEWVRVTAAWVAERHGTSLELVEAYDRTFGGTRSAE